MSIEQMKELKEEEKLANEHWQFVCKLLSFTFLKSGIDFIEYQEFLYKSAFIHGYKHAKENN